MKAWPIGGLVYSSIFQLNPIFSPSKAGKGGPGCPPREQLASGYLRVEHMTQADADDVCQC